MLISPQMLHEAASIGNLIKKNALSFEWIEVQETYTTRAQEPAMAWTF